MKINPKWTTDIKSKDRRLLGGGKKRRKSPGLGLGRALRLDITNTTRDRKNNGLNFLRSKAVALQRTGQRTKGQATVWEEMLANCIRQRLEYRAWKEPSTLSSKTL